MLELPGSKLLEQDATGAEHDLVLRLAIKR
jgi:hypothetical protein